MEAHRKMLKNFVKTGEQDSMLRRSVERLEIFIRSSEHLLQLVGRVKHDVLHSPSVETRVSVSAAGVAISKSHRS